MDRPRFKVKFSSAEEADTAADFAELVCMMVTSGDYDSSPELDSRRGAELDLVAAEFAIDAGRLRVLLEDLIIEGWRQSEARYEENAAIAAAATTAAANDDGEVEFFDPDEVKP